MQSFITGTLLAAVLVTGAPTTPKEKTNPPVVKQKGWVSLFDGKTTKGWHTYGRTTAGQSWKVVDGAIFNDASYKKEDWEKKYSADLVSDGEFENFHLKYDWKIAKNGNSGLIFWVQEDTAKYKQTYHTGPEMQVLDNDGHADGKIPKHRAANLYDLVPSTEGVVKAPGEWNTAEIISNKGKLEFILNGVSVMTTRYDDANWKTMIAGSKFKAMPGFGMSAKGHIALQDHGNDVWFKNIVIKQL